MTQYQQYIHLSRYARWIENRSKRESWKETVARYFDFFDGHIKELETLQIETNEVSEAITTLENAVINTEIAPAMRCIATAGEALRRDNTAAYNCAAVKADYIGCFHETLFVLLCGAGVGPSVERQFITKLPTVPEIINANNITIVVLDSKEGWADAYKELITYLYNGEIPKIDVTNIRPAGSRLKTFGGRASGPEPLLNLFNFTIEIFLSSRGKKLTSIDVSDIFCKIAEIVVVGGVRRAALIILSNLSDKRMAAVKTGQWWLNNPQRALANHSVAYTEKPDIGVFMEEWVNLYQSKSGERGIFNREASAAKASENGRRETHGIDFLCNPCSEIILRSEQFCNLSEVIVRPNDTIIDLKNKVEQATILGTWQSTLTHFPYLSEKWKKNCDEERLLGVSLTGIMDNALLNNNHSGLSDILTELKQVAIDTNKEWAKKLGINQSSAVTCVKPSGTVSQLVDCSSGIHPRHSEYYIRTVRSDDKDPLTIFLIEQGVSHEVDEVNASNYVFSFPVKSPVHAVLREDLTAIDHLELWLTYHRFWCEHKPSITVSVREHEWLKVGAWCYEHFDELSGVSFLPYSEHIYKQAPYQEIDKETYNELASQFPVIDWESFKESDDNTKSAQELACAGNSCEI